MTSPFAASRAFRAASGARRPRRRRGPSAPPGGLRLRRAGTREPQRAGLELRGLRGEPRLLAPGLFGEVLPADRQLVDGRLGAGEAERGLGYPFVAGLSVRVAPLGYRVTERPEYPATKAISGTNTAPAESRSCMAFSFCFQLRGLTV